MEIVCVLICIELQEEVERLRGELMAMNKMSGPFVGLESNDSENKDRIIEILQAKLQQNEKYITTFKDSQFNRVESKVLTNEIINSFETRNFRL